MSLPDFVAVKLDAYTLFCRQLLECSSKLSQAVQANPRLTWGSCCKDFNTELWFVLERTDSTDLQQVVEKLGDRLSAYAGVIQDRTPQVAKVFRDVVVAAMGCASTWSYQEDFQILHQQGRQLARHFYAESPWTETQERLDREAQLAFCYGRLTADARGDPNVGFGYRPVPLACSPKENVITAYFASDRDFVLYLSFPYLFMHEYVSHIFAFDYGNELFNDGWLLHSADRFLVQRSWHVEPPLDPPLDLRQTQAFGEHLYGSLIGIDRDACRFAWSFADWLGNDQCFLEMMWELAAFNPQSDRDEFWPTRFINRLEQEFESNRSALRSKIASASNMKALFEMLPPLSSP